MTLAEKLKSLRNEAGLSMTDLSNRIHMNPRAYENLERRGYGITVSRVLAICQVLCVSYHEHFDTYQITGRNKSEVRDRSKTQNKTGLKRKVRNTNLDTGFRTRLSVWFPKGNTNLERFFRDHFYTIKYTILQLVCNRQVAEDILIETFQKFSVGVADDNKYTDSEKASWLYRVSKNTALNYLRQAKRRNESKKDIVNIYPVITVNMIENNMIKAELLKRIIESLDNLPEKRRNIFKQVYLESKSTKQVSEELNISTDTIRVQCMRTLHYLEKLFRDDYEETKDNSYSNNIGIPVI